MNSLRENPEFDSMEISAELAMKRIEEVCEFYKDLQQQSKVVKKPKKDIQSIIANQISTEGG